MLISDSNNPPCYLSCLHTEITVDDENFKSLSYDEVMLDCDLRCSTSRPPLPLYHSALKNASLLKATPWQPFHK